MKSAVLAALLCLPLSLSAGEHCPLLFAARGGDTRGSKADALAIGWAFALPHRNVTISVRADSGYDDYSIVTTYLMRRIGPSTSKSAEVAQTSYELPPSFDGSWILFDGLDLPAGEYWLVFERPPHAERGEPEWIVSTIDGIHSTNGTKFLGTKYYSYVNHRTDYTPAAMYGQTTTLQGYQVAVTGIPVE
ncbi:MAG TPA: hypothetical protein VGF28_17805 [Thermoanaerobaculia bacterium]